MSYLPTIIINKEQLERWNFENGNQLDYPSNSQSFAIEHISNVIPFKEKRLSLVVIRNTDFGVVWTDLSWQATEIKQFLTENNIEHYLIGG